jgi:hypothetical protein
MWEQRLAGGLYLAEANVAHPTQSISTESVMTVGPAAGEQISQRLQESLDRLRQDIDRVELWAGALEVFSQPIPDYRPMRDHVLGAEKNSDDVH